MYQNYKAKNHFAKNHKSGYTDQFNKEDYAESVKKYYLDLALIPTLTKEEEAELIENHYLNGRFDEYARKRLLEGNLKFVFKVASFYRGNSGVPMADLISQGNEGLIKALEKFDVSKNIRFYCYAVWWIKARIQQYVQSQMKHSLREGIEFNTNINDDDDEEVFNNSAELWSDVETEENIEFEEYMFDDDDIADDNECEEDAVVDIDVRQTHREDTSRSKFFSQITSVLTEQEYAVIKYTFGLGGVETMSVREICETMQLKTSKVKNLKEKALSKLNQLACTDVILKEMYV